MPIFFATLNAPNLDLTAVPNPFVEGSPCDVTIFLGGKLLNLVNSNIDFSVDNITSTASISLVPSAGGVSLLPSAGNPITFGTDLQILTNVLSSLNTDENIVLSPNGTGSIILGNQMMNPPTLDSMANLFNLNSVSAGNLELLGNTLSSTNINGDIFITPNGTGVVNIAGIVFSNNNIFNINTLTATSIITTNLDAINASVNILTATTDIITPRLRVGNLLIVGNSIIAINPNGEINLKANANGNIIYHANLDANNNNLFNINQVTTTTLNCTNLNILSQTVSSPIYRGWIIYNPQIEDVYKFFNATIFRNAAGDYTVNFIVRPQIFIME